MARSLRLTCLLLLLPALALAADAADPIEALAQQRIEQAYAQAASPRGAAALFRLHELQDQLQDLGPLLQVDQKIAGSGRSDQLTRATARQLELRAQASLGRDLSVDRLAAQLGFIRDFQVLGAFDNEGKGGCDTDFGPESSLDLTRSFPVKGHALTWHPLAQASRDGYIDLGAALRPNQEAVGYALTFLKTDKPRVVTLALGVTGGYRLWVNGQLAGKSDRYNTAAPDQVRLSVPLQAGDNRVLLKVCQESGPFGFYLRQDGPRAAQASVELPTSLPPALKVPRGQVARALPTLSDALAALQKAHPNDAQLLADEAVVLAHTRAFDTKEHTDKVLAARAARLAPQDPALQLLAGDLEQQDHNVRRTFFEAALKLAPKDPRTHVALGQELLVQDRPEQARALAQEAIDLAPRYAAARLLLAKALESLDDWPGSVAQTETALKLSPKSPAVVRAAASVSRRLERPAEGLQRLRVANALRDDVGTAQALAGLLADLGKVDEAIRVLTRTVKSHPFENSARVRLAELSCANGKLKEGLAWFAQAKALAPDEPEILSREGQALLKAGRKEQAMASFERALALRPQNPAMQEVVRALKGETDSLGEQYAFDVKSLVKEADSYAGEDAVKLADYTYVRVQRSGLSARFHQVAVKVYSDRGVNAFRSYPITYSPDRQQVKVLRARITKPDGSVVESYGDTDRNVNDPGIAMYYDTRAKMLSFPALGPGDVLELQYRVEDTAQENLLSDYWGDVDYVQGTSPTLRYLYIADLPKGRPLYWNQDSLGKGITASQAPGKDGRTLYEWRAQDVSKIDPEPDMPGWSEVAATLHVSTYQTWDQVATYWWGLVRDQLTPNEDLKKTVEQVLAKVDRKDTRAVVGAIYDFVVTNTRYVALEFGIHGYKPYRVDQILARRFGDCKDKASLITAMLKLAGVDADLVLLRMRNLGTIGGTPASLAPFNHAIAYVPSLDLYLDGTAEFHGSGELPSVDHRADALIVDASGHGRFLVTPEVKADRNDTTLTLDVGLHADGSAEVKGQSDVRGENAASYRQSYQAVATRKAQFEQGWAQTFPGLKVEKVEMSDSSLLEQGVHLDYAMSVPRYAEVKREGLRFYPFGSGRRYTQSFAPLAERKFDLILSGPWVNRYVFRYALPKGMTVAGLPPDVEETSAFGHYRLSQKVVDGSLVCQSEVVITVDRVSAKDYPKFRAFLGRLDQAFQRRVELTRLPTQASAAP